MGGLAFVYCFNDFAKSKRVNNAAAEFVRAKIAEIVKDPATAEKLGPRDYPIGAKRLCVDSFYYQTFNRDNVALVDLKQEPIETVTASGVRTASTHHDLDAIILATGFDAMTGALKRIDIVGKDGTKLRRKWDRAPKTLLGLAVAGFPNLFLVTGPGSPSVFSNMVTSIEQTVDWIADCLDHMRQHGYREISATEGAEEGWFSHVNEIAGQTLMLEANSWYVGANVAGKPRVFMPYLAGVDIYLRACADSADNGYRGFVLS
jgi:cyclohexanone monooxygenase